MHIGCPTEIKPQEFRVGITPNAALEAIAHGHTVTIQTGAGLGAGFDDAAYSSVGAQIAATASDVFAAADMIVKVKEPQPAERKMLREGQILFTYLHLAPDPEQTHDLMASGATCIAYETVTDAAGGLPLLAPMSEVAGKLGPASWRMDLAKGQRRSRRFDGRRTRGRARARCCHWRWRCWHPRGTGCRRYGRGCHRSRSVAGSDALRRRCFWRTVQNELRKCRQHRRVGRRGGHDHRRRPDPRCGRSPN